MAFITSGRDSSNERSTPQRTARAAAMSDSATARCRKGLTNRRRFKIVIVSTMHSRVAVKNTKHTAPDSRSAVGEPNPAPLTSARRSLHAQRPSRNASPCAKRQRRVAPPAHARRHEAISRWCKPGRAATIATTHRTTRPGPRAPPHDGRLPKITYLDRRFRDDCAHGSCSPGGGRNHATQTSRKPSGSVNYCSWDARACLAWPIATAISSTPKVP